MTWFAIFRIDTPLFDSMLHHPLPERCKCISFISASQMFCQNILRHNKTLCTKSLCDRFCSASLVIFRYPYPQLPPLFLQHARTLRSKHCCRSCTGRRHRPGWRESAHIGVFSASCDSSVGRLQFFSVIRARLHCQQPLAGELMCSNSMTKYPQQSYGSFAQSNS